MMCTIWFDDRRKYSVYRPGRHAQSARGCVQYVRPIVVKGVPFVNFSCDAQKKGGEKKKAASTPYIEVPESFREFGRKSQNSKKNPSQSLRECFEIYFGEYSLSIANPPRNIFKKKTLENPTKKINTQRAFFSGSFREFLLIYFGEYSLSIANPPRNIFKKKTLENPTKKINTQRAFFSGSFREFLLIYFREYSLSIANPPRNIF